MTSFESQPRTAAFGFFQSGIARWYCFRRKGHEGEHRDYTTPNPAPDGKQCHALFEKPAPPFQVEAEAAQDSRPLTREHLLAALRDSDVNHVLHAYSYTEEQQADAILKALSTTDPDEWMDGSGERVIDLATGQYVDEGASESPQTRRRHR